MHLEFGLVMELHVSFVKEKYYNNVALQHTTHSQVKIRKKKQQQKKQISLR